MDKRVFGLTVELFTLKEWGATVTPKLQLSLPLGSLRPLKKIYWRHLDDLGHNHAIPGSIDKDVRGELHTQMVHFMFSFHRIQASLVGDWLDIQISDANKMSTSSQIPKVSRN